MKKIRQKLILSIILIAVLLIFIIPYPSTLYAQGGGVTGSIGNPEDAYLEFTLTGADLKLREGSTNHYVGSWTGGPITLSGKMIVKRVSDGITGGAVSYVRFYGYLVDQRNMFKWPENENYVLVQNRTETQEASITYTVPERYDQPTVEGKIELEVCGANACGKYEFFFHINILPLEETPTPTQTNTPAPSPKPDNCVWKLKQGMPQTTTSPTFDDVTILRQGTNLFMSAEGLSITHSWKPYPDVLVPGEYLNSEIVAEWAADRSLAFDEPCDVKTTLDVYYTKTLETGKSGVDLNLEPTGYLFEPFNYQVPTGKPDNELWFTIKGETCLGKATAMYNYFYSCPRTGPDLGPLHPIAKVPTQQVKCGGDSGFRFEEIWGQVMVYPCFNWDEEDVADYDYVVKWWDTIETSGSSGAILGFGYDGRFTMKAHSKIIIAREEEKGRWTLLYGRIKANVKQMIEKGTLDVTMNQAVSGTKATIFVAEDTGETSTLKVIEGEMWFQSLATGEMVDVVAGQMVSADVNGLSPITTFDIQAELATWPDGKNLDGSAFPVVTQEFWLDRLLPDFLRQLPLWVGILISFLGLAGLGLFVFLVFIRAIAKQKDAKKSSNAFRVILLAGLLSVSCLTSLCGFGGLYLSIRMPASDGMQSESDSAMAALAQTEMVLALQQTSIAQESIYPTPERLVSTESLPISTPDNTPFQAPTDPPTQTSQPNQNENQLTGDQFVTDTLIFDDFSSSALGWPVINDGNTVAGYENGAYGIQHKEKGAYKIIFLPVSFSPYVINFDARSDETYRDGTYGVICQYQDADNYYYLEINLESGDYEIVQVLKGEPFSLLDPENQSEFWSPLTALNPDPTEVNHFRVMCFTDEVSLSVNDEDVINVFSDQPFEMDGSAAFFVYTSNNAKSDGFKVILDNVEAY